MKWWMALALFVLGGLLVRQLFPKTNTKVVPGPPAKPDTVVVHEIDVDTIFRDRINTVVTTDTVNLTHTVTITDTVMVDRLEPRWYLDRLSVPDVLGDTTVASLVWLKADSTGIAKRQAIEKLWTAGYVRSVTTDSAGLHIDYSPFPEPTGCNFGCRLQWGLGGAAVGVLVGAVLK